MTTKTIEYSLFDVVLTVACGIFCVTGLWGWYEVALAAEQLCR